MLRMLFLVGLLVSAVSPTKADNFVITSGSTHFPATLSLSFTLSGSGFFMSSVATGSGITFPSNSQCPCVPGSLVSLGASSGNLDTFDLSSDSFFVNGVPYDIRGAGGLTFTTGLVAIPMTNDPLITLQAPFAFTGQFSGIAPDGTPLTANLSGVGTAEMTLRLINFDTGPAYFRQTNTFTFAPAPIPEPASILLLCSGVIGLAVKRRRSRRRT